MASQETIEKSIHAALASQENDKLKELLLELKFVLKDEESVIDKKDDRVSLYDLRDEDVSLILMHDDVKVRQFGAFCIAALVGEKAGEAIVDAYLNETVEYNKEHFVKALSMLPHIPGTDKLYDRMNVLLELLKDEKSESHKHYVKEARLLLGLLRTVGGKRSFTGQKLKSEIILTTNRNFREVTLNAIKGFPKKLFNAGVMTNCDDIDAVKGIRTYEEMLFAPPYDEEIFGDIGNDSDLARKYVKEILTPYVLERMKIKKGEMKLPVSFRLDIKGEPDKEKELQIQKTLSEIVEEESAYNLINIRNDFDIGIRFVARKTGALKPLVKFYLPRDERFTYKTTDIAAGLKPYLAALIANLCREYMIPDAKVLDPFCGAGTLLIEREKALPAEFLFGSDIFPAACAAAEKNLKKAGLNDKSKIINKDFLSLEHKERFNELITDLPFETEKKTVKELENVYAAFFGRSQKLLEKGSFMFVYTRNSSLFKKQIAKNNVTMIKCLEISKREGAYLFILKI